ncbi:MAG TPA: 4Fe-4S dicluster domain-containing protein [Methanocella sp.]|jgi:NAD-dependent dihydropyrimidine dehydrogenase PreA subunit
MKLLCRFSPGIIRQPILADAILETGIRIDIERARVDGSSGEIVINVPDKGCRSVVDFLRERQVDVTKLGEAIARDDKNCLNCGACVSICPVGAHTFQHDWSVRLDTSACVQCGACITACPASVLKLSSP